MNDDFVQLAMMRYTLRRPTSFLTLNHVAGLRSPAEIMEELRQVDPDGHALLSEHIVIEPNPLPGEERR